MVELLRSYSNRTDLCDDLVQTLARLHGGDDEPLAVTSVRSTRPSPRQWRIADKLTADDVHQPIASFEGGTPRYVLAERYAISLSSVGLLLRKHRAEKAQRDSAA